jgi:hypothetical protein
MLQEISIVWAVSKWSEQHLSTVSLRHSATANQTPVAKQTVRFGNLYPMQPIPMPPPLASLYPNGYPNPYGNTSHNNPMLVGGNLNTNAALYYGGQRAYAPAQAAPYFPQIVSSGPQTIQATSDPLIAQALHYLGEIRNLPQDEVALSQMGVNILFHCGQDALDLIRQKNIKVAFGDMGDSLAHAQWIKDDNLIMINQKYKNDSSWPNLYAISEAIYHEAGHAGRMGDDRSSIQEEIDCLALNTLAYRYHAATNPQYVLVSGTNRLIADGVALYAKLFFDPDPNKTALVNRVIDKYGFLPTHSPDHTIPLQNPSFGPTLADRVIRTLHDRQAGLAV